MNYDLYYAALAANQAWQGELQATYGNNAGDARYDERGGATEKLADLKDSYLKAAKAWLDESNPNWQP